MAVYDEYKDSGTSWLSQIPSEWKTGVIGSLYKLRNTKVSDVDYPPLSVTMKGIVPQLENAAKTDAHDARKLVLKGDFAINSRSDRRGSCGMSEYDGSVSLINTVLTPRKSMNPKYYNWLFHTVQFADEYYKHGHGIVNDLWTTRWDEMKRIIIPVPTDDEQSTIAEYLDKKVKHIDSIISEAKASIEEYKTWKASIIYEVVTKGLDPNAEMKDSGVEWIGKVPSNWKILRMKNIAEFMPKCDYSFCSYETEITFTPMECIRTGTFENQSKQYGEISGSYTQYTEGDIVLAKVTPCFENGNVCIMKDLYAGVGMGSSELFVLRPKKIHDRFLLYFLQHSGFKDAACATMTGTGGLKRVSSTFLQNCYIPCPNEQEQKRIADYLDEKCGMICSLIDEKEKLLIELESYKKSLIFEVVTGKRKVV